MDFKLELQKVSENTVALIDENLASNAGAVILDDFIVAMDFTMQPDTSLEYRKLLEKTFNRPVRYALITHYHGDHVFGMKPYKDVNLIGSKQLAANLKNKMETEWTPEAFKEWEKSEPEVSEWVDDVEILIPTMLIHNRLDIVNNDKVVEFHYGGGHTDCSTWGWFPSDKVLFAGDLLFSRRFPYAGDPSCDPEQWMKVFREWLEMDVDVFVPGHGDLADKQEIQNQLLSLEQFRETTLEVIKTGKEPADITLPSMYDTTKMPPQLVELTRNQWFEYYKNH